MPKPNFCLFIQTPVLRSVIAEQLKSWPDGTLHEIKDWAEVTDNDRVILLDQAAMAGLQSIEFSNCRALLFGVGVTAGPDTAMLTESFPLPLRLGHMLARMNYHLAFADQHPCAPCVFGPFILDTQQRVVRHQSGNPVIRLTEKESDLLAYLALQKDPVSREAILTEVWGYDPAVETHTLETHVTQLRRKLDFDNSGQNWILNEQSTYRLRNEP